MDEPDWDIYYWATNKKAPAPGMTGTRMTPSLVLTISAV